MVTIRSAARIVAWREGLGLAGVLLASLLPVLAGWPATTVVLAGGLVAGCWAWALARRPQPQPAAQAGGGWRLPFDDRRFRSLLAVFLLNGIATAIPATLVLFFVQDRLQAPPAQEALFLGKLFRLRGRSDSAVVEGGPPLRTGAQLAGRHGARGGGVRLGRPAGRRRQHGVLRGLRVVGHSRWAPTWRCRARCCPASSPTPDGAAAAKAAYFGWWNFATKLNLALAAGVALPALSLAGYAPGARTPEALHALTLAYCVLPCLLKLAAAALLYFHFIRPGGPR